MPALPTVDMLGGFHRLRYAPQAGRLHRVDWNVIEYHYQLINIAK